MTFVVTQSCCSDASCVPACPVNCIHPAPGEPGFAEAEMVYIDPAGCMDCGACVSACPVGAIVPHTKLTDAQFPFLELNASYYQEHPHADRTPLALVRPTRRVTVQRRVRVAVVGAGPAGLFTADELLRQPNFEVDVYDRLPTPYGLVRAGVAPDHEHTKAVAKLFEKIEEQRGFSYVLGVNIGVDVTHEQLREQYDAVVYAVGASTGRALGLEGETLPGCATATDFVAWYNGHPDHQEPPVALDAERAVVIGNGNVALDVARILTADPSHLAGTDIADAALAALRASSIREVVLLGRRGPAEASFTMPELIGLAGLQEVDVIIDNGGDPIPVDSPKSKLLASLAERPTRGGWPRIALRFRSAPVGVVGDDRVRGLRVARTELATDGDGSVRAILTDVVSELETGIVLSAVGYRGEPVAGLPFDSALGRVPNDGGRIDPGVYVAGWIKRGATGFIGTNKSCAQETVAHLLADLEAGLLAPGTPTPAPRNNIGLAGWRAIDSTELAAGRAAGRPRVKLAGRSALLAAAQPESMK